MHGYDPAEHRRLGDRARTLETLLHHDTVYPAGSRVLEAGCGVGAQTISRLIDPADFDADIRALIRTTEPDGTFCYTFFKAVCR